MKFFALVATLLVTLSAHASTCFTRTTSIIYNEVTLGNTLCFEKPELELNYFEDSYAVLKYTIDGQPAFKRTKLRGKFNARGNYEVKVAVESSSEGGMCDRFYEATSNVTLEISKDGSKVELTTVKGEVRYSYDQCHSGTDIMQSFDYERL